MQQSQSQIAEPFKHCGAAAAATHYGSHTFHILEKPHELTANKQLCVHSRVESAHVVKLEQDIRRVDHICCPVFQKQTERLGPQLSAGGRLHPMPALQPPCCEHILYPSATGSQLSQYPSISRRGSLVQFIDTPIDTPTPTPIDTPTPTPIDTPRQDTTFSRWQCR